MHRLLLLILHIRTSNLSLNRTFWEKNRPSSTEDEVESNYSSDEDRIPQNESIYFTPPDIEPSNENLSRIIFQFV